jgi:type IV pilus biogenesis protein CpaD/CtpE
MHGFFVFGVLVALASLSGCASPDAGLPDQKIGVMRNAQTGQMIAIPRPCPDWHQHIGQGLENEAPRQFGCADAYNLAHEIERPEDLIHGREAGSAEAAPGVLGIERYRSGKTKGLMNPKDENSSNKD